MARRDLLIQRLLLLAALPLAITTAALAGASSAATTVRHSGQAVVLLGNPTVASRGGTADAGRSEAFPFTALGSGVARTVHLYIGRSNAATRITAALYTAGVSRPRRLLTAGSLRHPAAGRWNQIAIRPVRLHAGSRVWIALLGTGGTLAYRDERTHGCRSQRAVKTRHGTLPALWLARKGRSTCSLSAYVTGTATAGGKPRPTKPPGGPTQPASGPTKPPTGTQPPTGPRRGCFAAPGACGYPDPKYGNVGPSSACSTLTPSGSITTSRNGQTIANLNISGTITVQHSGVTIRNVCVLDDGGSSLGSVAIQIQNGSGTVIENSTIAGLNTSDRSVDWSVANYSGSPATLSHDYIYNCGECIHNGPWTITDTYATANGMQGTSEHLETIYCDAGPGYTDAITANHDTLLAPTESGGVAPVAVLFCNTHNGAGGPCSTQVAITNSLLAGGAYLLYTCGNSSSAGSSAMSITNNRFARCTSRSCPDASGYEPQGGKYGLDTSTYCPPNSRQTWSANVWDDNLAAAGC